MREPHASYSGETLFPLIMQNLHRFFFYLVILISVLNTYDVHRHSEGRRITPVAGGSPALGDRSACPETAAHGVLLSVSEGGLEPGNRGDFPGSGKSCN